MVSRDIWSHSIGRSLQDLLASCCSSMLLDTTDDQPVYFSSPWMSNFILFENPFGEFGVLFTDTGDHPEFRFADFLKMLSQYRPVRLIVVKNPTSNKFITHLDQDDYPDLKVRFAPDTEHGKGILTPNFYIEGSMNLTYSGVHLRDEKVVFHPKVGNEEKLNLAFLQFNRFWATLEQ